MPVLFPHQLGPVKKEDRKASVYLALRYKGLSASSLVALQRLALHTAYSEPDSCARDGIFVLRADSILWPHLSR